MKSLLFAVLVPLVAAGGTPRKEPSANGVTSVMETAVICPTTNEKARVLYNQGTDFERERKNEEARKAYEQAIALDPKYCDAMDNLGLSLRQAGRLDEAIAWYRKSIAIAPKSSTARMNLAAALRMKKLLPESAAEYAALIKVLPKDPEGHYGLGSVRLEQGQAREAVPALLEAEKLYVAERSPYVSDAWSVLGRAYFKLEDWANAAKYLELLHAKAPNDPDLNLRLGAALVKLKKLDDAAKYLRRARALGKAIPPELASQAGL